MATWQAHFEMIGEGKFPPDFRHRLDAIVPSYASWSRNQLAWGEEDGNRITVLLEDDRPVEASFRVDMRDPDADFIRGVLEFARGAGLLLEDEFGQAVEPTERDFFLALRGSRAFRFVQDPELYLRRLELGGLSDA